MWPVLRLHDTATGDLRPLEPRVAGQVSMYVCGPTVYGPPHLGHGRFALVFDVLRRYLTWSGFDVRYVSNITDIDDKIIVRAAEEGRSTAEVAATYEELWWEVMGALGVAPPTETPHATQYVEPMVALIGSLVDSGAAYETGDGVYFRAEVVPDYGLLARQSLDSLRAGARVEVDDDKLSPVDFALWKKAKPGEPSWPSPWGPGRPGWHTECVVMALDLLGEGFDIHGGGQDLAFPHHENERAQAVAAGRGFASLWVHNGFVEMGGEKMSKSTGNFVNLVDLIESVDPRAYRLLVLRAHYRSPLEVTPTTTADAAKALERLDSLARRTEGWPGAGADEPTLAAFREHMDDDLDTPGAVAVMFTAVGQANQAADDGDLGRAASLAAAVRELCVAVGLELHAGGGEVDEDAAELARRRDEARAARDWATADALRSQIEALGYVVEDTPQGTALRR